MTNLKYVSKETKSKVMEILDDDSVHYFTKNIIREGLTKDDVDAYFDVKLALDALNYVRMDRYNS